MSCRLCQRERIALTVGVVDRPNLERKGLRSFVQAAAHLPDVAFVLAGRWDDAAADELRDHAPPNVTLTGWVEQDVLNWHMRDSSVYVQASAHEGFGMSVAEAMLAGCIPVTTRAGALPEVVDELGVQVDDADPRRLAAAIEQALAMDDDTRCTCTPARPRPLRARRVASAACTRSSRRRSGNREHGDRQPLQRYADAAHRRHAAGHGLRGGRRRAAASRTRL